MSRVLEDIVRALKAAGEPTRLRLLAQCHRAESSVSELVELLGHSQPRISRHLRVLCEAGLLERFRDGHWIYYRTPATGDRAVLVRKVLSLIPEDLDELRRDTEVALAGLAAEPASTVQLSAAERALNRAVLDALLSGSVGALLDIGTGSGRMLKLLGRRATRAVGVDVDGAQRLQARAELAAAGFGNCSVRAGDVHRLEFSDGEFDTVILDEVLAASDRPDTAVAEASRVLSASGRLLVIERLDGRSESTLAEKLARLMRAADLMLTRPRPVPGTEPEWLLSVAVASGTDRRPGAHAA